MADEAPRPFALRRFVPLGFLILAGLLFMALGGHRYLTIAAIAENRECVCDLVGAAGAMAALAFIVTYAGLVALSVPGAALSDDHRRVLFGPWLGAAYAVIGATIGATVVFLAARAGLAGLAARAGPWVQRVEAGFRRNGLNYLLVLRLIPIFPFWLVNLVAGAVGLAPLGLRARHVYRHHPGHLHLCQPRQWPGNPGRGRRVTRSRGPLSPQRASPDPRPCRARAVAGGLPALAHPLPAARRHDRARVEPCRPDLCVIGAGSGGLAVAAGAVQMGASVVLVERDRMGGDCLNYGCVPSKSLLAAARLANAWRARRRARDHLRPPADRFRRGGRQRRAGHRAPRPDRFGRTLRAARGARHQARSAVCRSRARSAPATP